MGPFGAALARASVVGTIAGLTAGLGAYMVGLSTDIDQVLAGIQVDPMLPQKAVIIGVLAFLGSGAVRGLAEGAYDQQRANTGDVKPSDVSMSSPKLTVIENATGLPVEGQKQP